MHCMSFRWTCMATRSKREAYFLRLIRLYEVRKKRRKGSCYWKHGPSLRCAPLCYSTSSANFPFLVSFAYYFETWKILQNEHGDDVSQEKVEKEMPRKVKKRRKIQTEDGVCFITNFILHVRMDSQRLIRCRWVAQSGLFAS